MQASKTFQPTPFLVLFMLWMGSFTAQTTAARSQMIFLTGGDILTSSTAPNEGTAHQAGVHVGSRFWLSDLFQVQGALTYQDIFSAEAALLFRPFSTNSRFQPYTLVGFGGFLDAEKNRTVVPVGIGIEYLVTDQLGVLFEVTGRWTLDDPGTFSGTSTDFGVMPSLGFSYQLNRLGRPARPPEPERTLPRLPPTETPPAVAENQPNTTQGATPRRARSSEPLIQDGYLIIPDGGVRGERVARSLIEIDTVRLKIRDNMVLVPDGTFILGLTDEDPLQLQTAGLRRITLSQFYIDQYEVSNEKYRAFVAATSSDMMPDTTMGRAAGNRFSWSEYFRGSAYANHPVVGVTHRQASQYCAYYGKRLPTEAEWEYAARAGELGGVYPWHGLETRDESGQFMANHNPGRGGYAADGYAFTAEVDTFPASRWGLYNMSGNVAEWVQDSFNPSYASLSDINPLYIDENESQRVIRGGSWGSDAFYIGVGVRDAWPADEGSAYIGFRCAQDISQIDDNQ